MVTYQYMIGTYTYSRYTIYVTKRKKKKTKINGEQDIKYINEEKGEDNIEYIEVEKREKRKEKNRLYTPTERAHVLGARRESIYTGKIFPRQMKPRVIGPAIRD